MGQVQPERVTRPTFSQPSRNPIGGGECIGVRWRGHKRSDKFVEGDKVMGWDGLACSGSSVVPEVPVTARVSRLDKDAQTNDGCLHESARYGNGWPHLYQFHDFNMPDLSDCGGMCAAYASRSR